MKDNEVLAWEKKGWNDDSLHVTDNRDPEKWYKRVGLEVAHRTNSCGLSMLRILEFGRLSIGGLDIAVGGFSGWT
jgi:hypothetical protein